MRRRHLLALAGTLPLLPIPPTRAAAPLRRVRPTDPGWPAPARWEQLKRDVGGRLVELRSPFEACIDAPRGAACDALFKELKNPYFIGDNPALTQTTGWADAWVSEPSAYAVAAHTTEDVAAAVNFARENKLRLVVKGGGHSYQGTSNAADSLLIWTRAINEIALHDGFVGRGCEGKQAPQPAVTLGAGTIWIHAYNAVTTDAGRYVQGGGCMTVGVAGLIQSGGFGSFSKNYGMAAAGLLEAEIVTADGVTRTANACNEPELFWGLKGGGGSSLGVVTRLTLRTRELPEFFGGVNATIQATSDAAFRRLIGRMVAFYAESLFNPHWGEQIRFQPDNSVTIAMVFQGLDKPQAEAVWRPFLDWIAGSPQDFRVTTAPRIVSLPARNFWNPALLKRAQGVVLSDDRPGAPADNVFWAGNLGETGVFLHAYQSTWLPASLLRKDRRELLADTLFAATRHWWVAWHCNKGLAGAPAEAVAAARDTAMNPAVLDAFALAIVATGGPPARPGVPGHEPDLALARQHAASIDAATGELRKLVAEPGSYVSESNYFEPNWQRSFWGSNYPRLLAVKRQYDPDGLFFVHHGVGSEDWSADGFTRLAGRR
ncbi:MAG: FAD-binding oxidoreductase [Alphaproteobacteria bacterium]|nr:FAD-binding oxidoreductase [Alphaproteobacteria bacterium]